MPHSSAASSPRHRPCPNCAAENARVRFVEPPFFVVACPRCSLVYLGNPPPEEALYEEYYAAPPRSDAYHAASADARLRELHAINTQRVEGLTRLKPTGTLLDVGCGRGYFLHTAREHGYDVCGIDVSERAVGYARKTLGLRADARLLESVARSGETFDVVTLWHVLEHFADPYHALALVRDLLNDGGLCLIEVPNLHSLKFMLAKNKWEGGNHPLYHRTFFTATTLRRALAKTGFSKARRLQWSYRVPGRSNAYEHVKRLLNRVGMDAFLDFAAWK